VFEIARGMKSILMEDALRARLVERGTNHISKFSWTAAAKQVIEAYKRAAG